MTKTELRAKLQKMREQRDESRSEVQECIATVTRADDAIQDYQDFLAQENLVGKFAVFKFARGAKALSESFNEGWKDFIDTIKRVGIDDQPV